MSNRKFVLGALGLAGCVSLYWLPTKPVAGLSEQHLRLIQPVQPVLLLIAALYAGDRYSRRVGFGAVFDGSVGFPGARTIAMDLAIGCGTAALSVATYWLARPLLPVSFVEAAAAFEPPLLVRLLYGSLTEEIVMRWGLMSWVAWLMTRLSKRSMSSAWPMGEWSAATLVALIFGAAHLPLAFSLTGGADGVLAAFIVAANFPIGLAAGIVFARHGIELAMLVHAAAGVVIAALS